MGAELLQNAVAPFSSLTLGSAPLSRRKMPIASWPLALASSKGVIPPGPASFTFAPAANRIPADSTSPTRAANINGVKPPFEWA